MLATILLILTSSLALFFIVQTLYGFVGGAPLVYSPRRAIEKALRAVDAQPGERFYDLGAGSGRALIIAKKFNLETFGFELSPIAYALAKFNLFLNDAGSPGLRLGNFYNHDLGEADIVFCFLSPRSMDKLRPKFEKELKKGARVISYAFRINGWTEKTVFREGYPGKVYIYVKQ